MGCRVACVDGVGVGDGDGDGLESLDLEPLGLV